MQTTAIETVANSLPKNEVISLTILISGRYILFAELINVFIREYMTVDYFINKDISSFIPSDAPFFMNVTLWTDFTSTSFGSIR